MTIEECYRELGGNFAEVSSRIPGKGMIEKFTIRFLDDKSFEKLELAFGAGKREEAFRAAHTLKGVCANLSFTCLQKSAGKLTEVLRLEEAVIPSEAAELFEEVKRDYRKTAEAIVKFSKDQ